MAAIPPKIPHLPLDKKVVAISNTPRDYSSGRSHTEIKSDKLIQNSVENIWSHILNLIAHPGQHPNQWIPPVPFFQGLLFSVLLDGHPDIERITVGRNNRFNILFRNSLRTESNSSESTSIRKAKRDHYRSNSASSIKENIKHDSESAPPDHLEKFLDISKAMETSLAEKKKSTLKIPAAGYDRIFLRNALLKYYHRENRNPYIQEISEKSKSLSLYITLKREDADVLEDLSLKIAKLQNVIRLVMHSATPVFEFVNPTYQNDFIKQGVQSPYPGDYLSRPNHEVLRYNSSNTREDKSEWEDDPFSDQLLTDYGSKHPRKINQYSHSELMISPRSSHSPFPHTFQSRDESCSKELVRDNETIASLAKAVQYRLYGQIPRSIDTEEWNEIWQYVQEEYPQNCRSYQHKLHQILFLKCTVETALFPLIKFFENAELGEIDITNRMKSVSAYQIKRTICPDGAHQPIVNLKINGYPIFFDEEISHNKSMEGTKAYFRILFTRLLEEQKKKNNYNDYRDINQIAEQMVDDLYRIAGAGDRETIKYKTPRNQFVISMLQTVTDSFLSNVYHTLTNIFPSKMGYKIRILSDPDTKQTCEFVFDSRNRIQNFANSSFSYSQEHFDIAPFSEDCYTIRTVFYRLSKDETDMAILKTKLISFFSNKKKNWTYKMQLSELHPTSTCSLAEQKKIYTALNHLLQHAV